jgi:hypothetical protein
MYMYMLYEAVNNVMLITHRATVFGHFLYT